MNEQAHVQPAAEVLRQWVSQEDHRSFAAPDGQVYYLSKPSEDADIVACGLEQTRSPSSHQWSKSRSREIDSGTDVHAVYFRCAACKQTGRIDAAKKPFHIGGRRMIRRKIRQPDGTEVEKAVPLAPLLTVESPVECGLNFTVHDTDAGTVQEMLCTYHVVIRDGIAYPVTDIPQILTQAMRNALLMVQKATAAFAQRGRTIPVQFQQKIAQDLGQFQQGLPVLQQLAESGNYDRGGPKSLVQVWVAFDHISKSCDQMLQALGVRS